VALGGRGDVLAAVPVCQALTAAGHSAVLASTADYQRSVELHDVSFMALGKTKYVSTVEDAADETWTPPGWNAFDVLPQALSALMDTVDKSSFDVILSNAPAMACAARVAMARSLVLIKMERSPVELPGFAGYKQGIVKQSTMEQLWSLFTGGSLSAEEKACLQEMQSAQKVDLKASAVEATIRRTPTLRLWSTSVFSPSSAEARAAVLLRQPSQWRGAEAVLHAFAGKRDDQNRRPVVLTFGPVPGYQQLEDELSTMISELGWQVLVQVSRSVSQDQVSLGDGRRSSSLQPMRSQLHKNPRVLKVESYVPHEWLFPQSSIVFCHGGAGTIQRAIWAGASVVVCPVASPVGDGARKHGQLLSEAGLGVLMNTMSPTKSEVEEILKSAWRCRKGAHETSEAMAAQKSTVVDELVRLTTDSRESIQPGSCWNCVTY